MTAAWAGVPKRRLLGLFLGPTVALLILLSPEPQGLPTAAWRTAAIVALMAIWWITEAIPIAATALVPIALFPAFGVMTAGQTTSAYGNQLIYLFLGGFLIAMAMQRWNLHKRIALHVIRWVGTTPNRVVLGFMAATAFLSMWVSNTATAMMMLPIGMAVIEQLAGGQANDAPHPAGNADGHTTFGTALMLGIAYAASLGGIATLIGTPPNAVLAGMVEKLYGQTITFAAWLVFALPLSAVLLLVAWFYLTRVAYSFAATRFEGAGDVINAELAALGRARREEIAVAGVFLLVAAAWVLRGFVDIPALKTVSDSTIAIIGALLLFVIPVNLVRGEFLLDWASAVKLPWDVIILFGGGFALAQGIETSGLADWLVGQLSGLRGVGIWVLVACITLGVTFLTEITSNTATATLVIPVAGALASAVELHPYALMVPAALAASCAFMLPVATPPNAVVFGSRYVTIPQMARAGLWMNLLASAAIIVFVLLLLPPFWGIAL